jgi:hypothetical protein
VNVSDPFFLQHFSNVIIDELPLTPPVQKWNVPGDDKKTHWRRD